MRTTTCSGSKDCQNSAESLDERGVDGGTGGLSEAHVRVHDSLPLVLVVPLVVMVLPVTIVLPVEPYNVSKSKPTCTVLGSFAGRDTCKF